MAIDSSVLHDLGEEIQGKNIIDNSYCTHEEYLPQTTINVRSKMVKQMTNVFFYQKIP